MTNRELQKLLRNFERGSPEITTTRRSSGRPVARERLPALSEQLTELLVDCFNSLPPDQKRDFFRLRTAYQKIGFLVRWRVMRESEEVAKSNNHASLTS